MPPKGSAEQAACDPCDEVMEDSDLQGEPAAVATDQRGGAVKLDSCGGEAAWRNLPCVPLDPPNPCRNWMGTWSSPCERLCCHTHPSNCPCADIGCDGCGYSIVRPEGATTISMNGFEPTVRFVCLDCPANADYDSEHWSHQLCDSCFASCTMAPHFGADGVTSHANWLRISPAGEHCVVQRDTAGVVLAEIVASDLVVDGATGACLACMDDYSEDNPRASPPGCTAEAHKLYCAECTMSMLESFGKHRYVKQDDGALPPPTYFCERCESDVRKRLEVASVLRELQVLRESGTDREVAVQQLKSAHALKPGSEVNVHLHEALDEHVAKEAAPVGATQPAKRVPYG